MIKKTKAGIDINVKAYLKEVKGLYYVVLVYVNADGQVYINNATPTTVKAAFRTIGINC